MALNTRTIFILFSACLLFFSASAQKYEQTGNATYYHNAFQGRYTSSGEIFDNAKYTAAHATLPFQTLVKITNLKNNKYVIVKINDRCAAYPNHVVDLSQSAAKKLDIMLAGVASVKLEVLTPLDLNYLIPCPDSILKNIESDSVSIKCNGLMKKYSLLPMEQHIYGNMISSHIKVLHLRIKIKEVQKLLAMNFRYVLNFQHNLS